MKRFVFALGLVAATSFAAPLAAQSRNDGPWWDPANTGSRGSVDTRTRDGRVYSDGRIYDSRRADGQWRRVGRDGTGNYVYERTRYDSRGNLVVERARRDSLGRYRILDRRVIQTANRGDGRDDGRDDGRYEDRDDDGDDDRYDDRYGRDKNDRWEQNNGHDNGKHNGRYKNRGNGKRR